MGSDEKETKGGKIRRTRREMRNQREGCRWKEMGWGGGGWWEK